MLFDPSDARLLQIRLGDYEVLRRIFAVVRNEDWATAPSAVSNLKTDISSDSFRLTFDVDCRLGIIDYLWRGLITGEASGEIMFSFDGISRSEFRRNRLGICVLHPIMECAGKPFKVEHWDGRAEEGSFPRWIAPQQPCFDIRSFAHEVAPGVRAELHFEGEVFEMEDQRNYTDASFKIYSTPQAWPKPVAVAPGDKVNQTVTLRLKGPARTVLPIVQGRVPQLSIATTPVFPLPPIGLGCQSEGRPLTPREIERLKALRLSHLRVDLKISSAGWREALHLAVDEAAQLNVGLHVAFTLSDNAQGELQALAEQIRGVQVPLLLWIVRHENESPASEASVRLAREALQNCAPGVLFAAGAKKHFYELNNNRPDPHAAALPCFPTNPQVHLTDDSTLRENVAGAAYTAESAKEFCSKPVVISPFTLRGSPNAGRVRASASKDDLPPEVDPRQMSLFGAAWTLASLARLFTTGNVHSVTCFETTGWRGIMETEAGSWSQEKFPSIPGAVFPSYHVLADIGEFPVKQVYTTHSSHPGVIEGMTLFDDRGRRRIFVVNLTDDPQDVKIKTGTCRGRVRYLDETNAEAAMRNPETFRAEAGRPIESLGGKLELKLLPCAIVTADIEAARAGRTAAV
jgi:hypothetical protein